MVYFCSPTTELEPSVPLARRGVQRDRHGQIAGQEREENQPETRARPRQARFAAPPVQPAARQRHDRGAEQRLRGLETPGQQPGLLALPLSLPLPHSHRHELSLPRRHSERSAARSVQLPTMWRLRAAHPVCPLIPVLCNCYLNASHFLKNLPNSRGGLVLAVDYCFSNTLAIGNRNVYSLYEF